MWLATWAFLAVALHGAIAAFVPHIRGAVVEYGYKIPYRQYREVRSADLNTPPYTYSFNKNPKEFFYSFSKWCNYYQCMIVVELAYRGNIPNEQRRQGVEMGNSIDKFRVNTYAANHAVGWSIHPIQVVESREGVATRIKVAVYTESYACKVRTYVLERYWTWEYYVHANTVNCEDDRDYFSNDWVRHRWRVENPGLVQYGAPLSRPQAQQLIVWPPRRASPPQRFAARPPPPSQQYRPPPPSQQYRPPPPSQQSRPPPPPQQSRPPPPPQRDSSVAQGAKHTVLLVTGEVDEYDYTVPDYYVVDQKQEKPNDKRYTYIKYVKKPGVENNDDDSICTVLLTFDDRKVELYKVTCEDDETPIKDIWGSIFLVDEEEDSTGKYINVIVRMYTTHCTVRKFKTSSANILHERSKDCGDDPHYVLTEWAQAKYKKEQRHLP